MLQHQFHLIIRRIAKCAVYSPSSPHPPIDAIAFLRGSTESIRAGAHGCPGGEDGEADSADLTGETGVGDGPRED